MSLVKKQDRHSYKDKKESAHQAIGYEDYNMITRDFLYNASFILSPTCHRFLIILVSKFRGAYKKINGQTVYTVNNGDLSLTQKEVSELTGKKISYATLDKAIREMIEKGFIIKTRQGGKNNCSLYALTYSKIGNFKGKIDHPPTDTPSNEWRTIAMRNGTYRPIIDKSLE